MARRGDGIYLRGRTWWLDFRHDGKRYVVRFGTQHQPDGRARHRQREAGGDPERGGGDLHEISRHTPLISSNTSSLVSRPFLTRNLLPARAAFGTSGSPIRLAIQDYRMVRILH